MVCFSKFFSHRLATFGRVNEMVDGESHPLRVAVLTTLATKPSKNVADEYIKYILLCIFVKVTNLALLLRAHHSETPAKMTREQRTFSRCWLRKT